MSSRFFLASFLISALFFPLVSGAATVSDLETRIAALLTQIQTLQTELQKLKSAEVTPTAPQTTTTSFITTLGKGSIGADVTRLQTYLAQDPSLYPEGTISGYFGVLTEAAVKRFQGKHGIVSSGTPESTGYGVLGPKTRTKLNTLLSTTSSTPTTPISTPTPTPYTPNTPNRSPNLSVTGDRVVFLPNSASLTALVTDDGKPSGILTYLWSKSSGPGSVSFSSLTTKDTTVSFSAAGNYQITVTVSDGDLFASYTIAILVKEASLATPPLSSTSTTLPASWTLTDIGNPSPLGNITHTNGIFTLRRQESLQIFGKCCLPRACEPIKSQTHQFFLFFFSYRTR